MVTDFGLVSAAEADAGTPAYMAPEQRRGESLDPRMDTLGNARMLKAEQAG
jgi:serine/threonine protein kinase